MSGWEIQKTFKVKDYNGFRVVAEPSTKNESDIKKDKQINNYLFDYFHDWYKNLSIVEEKISSINTSKKFVIWGAGAHTEFLYQLTLFFSNNSDSDFIIVDSDPLKTNRTWRGINIYKKEILKDINWDDTLLVISSYGGQEEIYKEAINLNIPKKCISKLYETVKKY